MILKFRRRSKHLDGGHLNVAVFVGVDEDHLQLAGDIRLRPEEWEEAKVERVLWETPSAKGNEE